MLTLPEYQKLEDRLQESLARWNRYIRRTYPPVTCPGGQDGEDDILAELLPQPTGTYVDVGAGEPIECSNTWQFYQRGWRGLLIEPVPQFFPALLRQRPGDHLWPVAASNWSGFQEMRLSGTVSSLRPDWDIQEQGTIVVEVQRLADILAMPDFQPVGQECLLCSIDVEGMEKEVLEGIDFAAFRPLVFILERIRFHPDRLGEDTSRAWGGLLRAAGYAHHATTRFNKIFVREGS